MKKRTLLLAFILLFSILFSFAATAAKEPLCHHRYSGICDTACDLCGKERTDTPEHDWMFDCDAQCDTCGTERTVTAEHTYGICATECMLCGAARPADEDPHTYTNDCSMTCFFCGAERTQGFSHRSASPCATKCLDCEATLTPNVAHTFSADCDRTCNVCQETCEREHAVPHTYAAECAPICSGCNEPRQDLQITHKQIIMKDMGDGTKLPYCEACGMIFSSNLSTNDGNAVYFANGELFNGSASIYTITPSDEETDIDLGLSLPALGCSAAIGTTSAMACVLATLTAIGCMRKKKED